MVCPICKAPVDETERDRKGSFYPFCSDRCRLIDLGRWLKGRYQIPVNNEETGQDQGPSELPRREDP